MELVLLVVPLLLLLLLLLLLWHCVDRTAPKSRQQPWVGLPAAAAARACRRQCRAA
jgi:hypothetical protein